MHCAPLRATSPLGSAALPLIQRGQRDDVSSARFSARGSGVTLHARQAQHGQQDDIASRAPRGETVKAGHHHNALTALAAITPIVTSETDARAETNSFARPERGSVSVGPNAVAAVNATKR